MKALVIEAPGDLRLIETPKPVPGPRDVVSRVVYSGICGTDLGIFSGKLSFVKDGRVKFPLRIGHEWAGVVDSVGRDVAGFKPGDRVVSDSGVTCGVCPGCLEGGGFGCADSRALGTINAWDYGSFAEYILIPEWNMYRLDDAVSLEQGALIEPSTIALSGIDAIGAGGDVVLITGTGAVGLCAAALSKALGAKKVVVAGRKQLKLDIALKVGADAAINLTHERLADAVMRESDGRGAVKIIETTGSSDIFAQAVDCASPCGAVALLGFYDIKAIASNFLDNIVLKSLIIKGANGARASRRVMALMAGGAMDVSPLITGIYPLDSAVDVFESAGEKSAANVKMLIKCSDI